MALPNPSAAFASSLVVAAGNMCIDDDHVPPPSASAVTGRLRDVALHHEARMSAISSLRSALSIHRSSSSSSSYASDVDCLDRAFGGRSRPRRGGGGGGVGSGSGARRRRAAGVGGESDPLEVGAVTITEMETEWEAVGGGGGGRSALASLAHLRSSCPQPPLDDGRLLGGSAAPPEDGGGIGGGGAPALAVEMDLNPPERVPPHRVAPGAAPLIDLTMAAATTTTTTTTTTTAAPARQGSGGGEPYPFGSYQSNTIEIGDNTESNAAAAANALKAITALSALCDEADDLRSAAESRVLPRLALFGTDLHLSSGTEGGSDADADSFNDDNDKDDDGGGRRHRHRRSSGGGVGGNDRSGAGAKAMMDERATRKRDTDLLRRMGKFLPSLQSAFNLSLRAQRLVRNMVCQIGACASTTSFSGAGPAVLGPTVRLLPVATAAARILKLLLSIDAVVMGNAELHEAWDLYKSVMRDRAMRMQKDGVRDAKLESFERLLVQLDYTLMSGRCFEICVEQNFDAGMVYCQGSVSVAPPTEKVSAAKKGGGNVGGFSLHGEIRHLLTVLYRRICSKLDAGTFDDVSDDADLAIGLYGLYCLYRRLLPSRLVPDASLHKALWNLLPSRRTVLPLYGSVPFFPRRFLLEHAPYEGLKGCGAGMDPADVLAQSALEFAAKSKQAELDFVALARKIEIEAVGWLAAAESDLAPSACGGNGDGDGGGDGGANTGGGGAGGGGGSSSTGVDNDSFSFGGDDLFPPGLLPHPSSLSDDDRAVASVARKVGRIRRGVALARRASSLLRRHLLLHRALDARIPPSHAPILSSLCSVAKSIEKALRVRHRSAAIAIKGAAVHATASGLYDKFERLRGVVDAHGASASVAPAPTSGGATVAMDVESDGLMDEARAAAAIGAALSVLEGLLKGTLTTLSPIRRHALEVSVCVCAGGTGAFGAGGTDDDGVGGGGGGVLGGGNGGATTMMTTTNTTTTTMSSAAAADLTSPDRLLASVRPLLDDLGLLSDLDDAIRRATDCSFLYFHRAVLPSMVRDMYQSGALEGGDRGGGGCFGGLQLVLSAFSDPAREVLRCFSSRGGSDEEGGPYLQNYRALVRDVLWKELIDPLSQRIETDLRLAAFARDAAQNKGYQPVNPKQDRQWKFRSVLEMPPLRCCGMIIDVREEVGRYLEGAFYKFCTVALHDSKVYVEMRAIARAVYGLELMEDHLPFGSFQEHVDVVRILRSLDEFAANYNYDMNEQLFVQRRPGKESKYFASISMKCICKSVKHYGLGIVGGSLGSVHHFIITRIDSMSQTLANDRLRSLVSKELRWLGNQIKTNAKGYTFDRATVFSSEIGKLDVTESGSPALERLRRAVSELGNSLAFIRTMRSAEVRLRSEGSLHFSSGTHYGNRRDGRAISELDKQKKETDESTAMALEACPKRNYLYDVLEMTRKDIKCSQALNIDKFYLLIPALCLSWTEASLQGKEMMHKKNLTRDAYFTDDGFAVGLAFMLAALHQENSFDEINWFPCVREKIEREGKILSERIGAEEAKRAAAAAGQKSSYFPFSRHSSTEEAKADDVSEDDDLATARTKQRSLKCLEREMNTLFFAIHGARFFWRS